MKGLTNLLFLLGLGLAVYSCSNDSADIVEDREFHNFGDLLITLTTDAEESVDVLSDEMMVYHIEWNKIKGVISVIGSEKSLIDFFPIAAGKNINGGDSYNVDCCFDNNGDIIFSKTCSGKFSCGNLIAECLEDGGCAEICNATITIIPSTSTSDGLIEVSLN